jgi:formate dehydrogenase major subunit
MNSEVEVTVHIDGMPVTVPEGTSVMRAAAIAGANIPKLCATDNVEAFGSCRLCLVEIEGRNGTPASCTTPCQDGMSVKTQTTRLDKLRKGVMELYISDHPLDCLTCPANGDCELQDMAGAVGLRDVRYGTEGENHLAGAKDESNPYFTFDTSKCIVCSRCVRACSEVQGTFALTIAGRGFGSRVSPSEQQPFLESECVSCGACVQACPTATLQEKSVIELGVPSRKVKTTCAYCGVGCSFVAELRGDEVVRMVPDKEGGANAGHSCVKGRFAWGYAQHQDRITTPMVRESIDAAWREVSWEEAIGFAADRFNAIKASHGVDAIGGITSSRCTNEEVYVVQKMVRAAFGTNNVDTCARVCHSPTGYGLKQTFGTSAGTQDFASVEQSDAIMVIGANPTDAHPVFGSRMKRRLREGADLIVIDPRSIDLVRSPHIQAEHHLQLMPGTNVAVLNAISHVVATEGLMADDFVHERCNKTSFKAWLDFISLPENSPEALADITGVDAESLRAAARAYATAGNGAIYYGLGVTEHSQGSTMVMAMANSGDGDGQYWPLGRGREPAPWPEQRAGLLRHGLFPPRVCGLPPRLGRHRARAVLQRLGRDAPRRPRHAHPEYARLCGSGAFKGIYIQGEDIAQSDPNTNHVAEALRAMECVIVQDLFLERDLALCSRVSARYLVPRERRHLYQRRAAHQSCATGDDVSHRTIGVGGHLRPE